MFMTKEEIAADVAQWHSKGFCCFIERNCDNVILAYKKDMELDPLDTYIYCSRGEVYRYKGKYDAATMEYHNSLSLDLE